MKGKIAEAHHGKMFHEEEECAASLVVFEFEFISQNHEARHRSVRITVEFFDKGGKAIRDPAVVKTAPDRLRFPSHTAYTRNRTTGGNIGADVVGVNLGVNFTEQTTKVLKSSATLVANSGFSAGKTGEMNGLTWSMKENTTEADGVPSFLQTALLLKHSDRLFYAQLRVSSEVDGVSTIRRFVQTDVDKIIDPVTFTPSKRQVRNNSVTRIEGSDLARMEELRIGEYFRVDFDENDARSQPSDAVQLRWSSIHEWSMMR
ncbi:MAG: hypothetical protein MMC23_001693 [Stictis urceolatum]|nr:hypothetical protein [Stictis urceolata]